MTARPLRWILQALAAELRDMENEAAALQTALSPLVAHVVIGRADAMALQGVDRLTQHLAALHAFVDALGPMAPAEYAVNACEATDGLPLAMLAARLNGVGTLPTLPAAGMCEMFD